MYGNISFNLINAHKVTDFELQW